MIIEEASRGTIDVNKRADLVVLDANPLTVDPIKIKDITVLERESIAGFTHFYNSYGLCVFQSQTIHIQRAFQH